MIVALMGSLCSGKATVALYLCKEFGFQITNLYHVLAKELDMDPNDPALVELFFSGKQNRIACIHF